ARRQFRYACVAGLSLRCSSQFNAGVRRLESHAKAPRRKELSQTRLRYCPGERPWERPHLAGGPPASCRLSTAPSSIKPPATPTGRGSDSTLCALAPRREIMYLHERGRITDW